MRSPLASALLLGLLAAPACDSSEPAINYPPYVVNAAPDVGEIIQPGGSTREISSTLADENVNDRLYVRYLVDYPTAGDLNAQHLVRELELPPSGTPVRLAVHIQPNCQFLNLPAGTHRFVMAVSDRPFLDAARGDDVSPEAPFDSVPDGANRIRVVWLLDCP